MTATDQTGRRTVWAAGLLVASGAGAATAHGLYQVAIAARVPEPIAWLYPLITDGLALVAYAATSRLVDGGRRYAASIVVLAAGMSGLAQAVYLAGAVTQANVAPIGLRFGVGAWPALTAALTAHLLHLISARPDDPDALAASDEASRRAASNPSGVQPDVPPGVQLFNQTAAGDAVRPPRTSSEPEPADLARPGYTGGSAPARDRARQAAHSHHARQGRLPTVSELMKIAEVARGTAGTVLKELRTEHSALHVVTVKSENGTQP